MMNARTNMRDPRFVRAPQPPRVAVVPTTMLTKRRAVDHCRVRSALCRMP